MSVGCPGWLVGGAPEAPLDRDAPMPSPSCPALWERSNLVNKLSKLQPQPKKNQPTHQNEKGSITPLCLVSLMVPGWEGEWVTWGPQSGWLAQGETAPSMNSLAAEEYQLQGTVDGFLGNAPGTFRQIFFPTTPFTMTMEVISS